MDISPLNPATSQSPRFQPHPSPGSPALNLVPNNHLKQSAQQHEDGSNERAALYTAAMSGKMAAHGRSEAADRQMTTVSHNGSLGRNSSSLLKESCPDSSSLTSSPCRTMQLPSGESHTPEADSEVSREFQDDMDCDSDRDEEVPVECAECGSDFPSMQDYVDHSCHPTADDNANSDKQTAVSNNSEVMEHSSLDDAESFNGKIVYNPDGSAYIIEGSDSEDGDLDMLEMPRLEGAIVDRKGHNVWSSASSIPQIASAVFVTKGPSSVWSNTFRTSPSTSSSHRTGHGAPTMYSFRVYDVHSSQGVSDKDCNSVSSRDSDFLNSDLPAKPILMCFICKLSFGYAKSFIAHAIGEHGMDLNQEERTIMARPKASAILQGVGKEKNPLMSFLDPLPPPPGLVTSSGSLPSGSTHFPYFLPSSASKPVSKVPAAPTKVSYMYTKPKMSKDIAHSPPSGSQDSQNQYQDESGSRAVRDVPYPGMDDSIPDPEDEDSTGPEDSNGRGLTARQESLPRKLTTPSPRPLHTTASSAGPNTSSARLETSESISLPPSLDTMSALGNTVSAIPGSHMTGMFLGSCDEHPQGRAQGVECPKCDMVLGSSQSLGGHMTMMHSRNSCKTLKCPKCNWHYKYQETLEIHMKEKHPDNDAQCIYCLTNQQHPRLARGETYSCGYKPYRCEVCNYSTTTKGNLSIHMQSDKHMNNMQELANGSADMPLASTANHGPSPTTNKTFPPDDPQYKKLKPKQSWRCDVCNYETMVARNLRIHMTSEKHTHNMMVLQQNMKHMRRDMQLQMNQLMLMGQQDPAMFGLPNPLPPGLYPYDQSMLMPGAPPMFDIPVNLARENGSVGEEVVADTSDASKLYQCCICSMHVTDSLDSLHQHLQLDRTKQRESDNISVSNGTYMCNLCTYKTNLKANFQLHCKTDKHIQRLQLVNHIKEGGPANEWRLNFINASNPTQVRCNACNFYTSSVHKLQVHAGSIQHESNAHVFRLLQLAIVRLQATAGTSGGTHYYYRCVLCACNARTKQAMVQHARTLKHLQHEQAQLNVDPRDIFIAVILQDGDNVVYEYDEHDGERASEVTHNSHPPPATQDTPDKLDLSTATPVTATTTTTSTACISNINKNNNSGVPTITNAAASKPDIVTTESSNVRSDDRGESPPQTKDVPDTGDAEADQQKVQRSVSPGSRPDSRSEVKAGCVLCPLCQDECQGLSSLQSHLALSHKVTQEGMQRLLAMVDLPSVGAAADSADGSPDDHDAANGNGDSQTLAPSSASPTSAGTGVSAAEGFDEDVELDVERLEVEHQKLIVDDAVDGSVAGEKADPNEDQYRCQICTKTFINIDLLYAHQNELGHLELKQTPRGPGYLCWKKGCNQYFKTAQALQVHFREIHCKRSVLVGDEVIKQTFSCGQCTLVFRSEDALQKHHQYHLIKAITQCSVCQLIFHSVKRLRSHLSMAHNELKPAEQETLLKGLDANLALLKNSPGSETFLDTLLGGGLNPATNTTSSHPSAADSTRSTLPHITSEKNSQDKPVSKQKGVEVSSVVSKQEEMLDEAGLQGSAGDSQSDGSDKMELDEEAEQLEMLKKSFPDQQSLEDFINSQAMAEGNYEDPSRKFKCHRCKVGFTKQSYLTAHNKTLQHRRGDKVNYSVERYLDPSRPHKCDVCKESFTQKNILLVHYNSVSHLHKMKQATQQGMLPSSVASTSADPSPSPSPTQTSTTAASSSSTTTTTTTNGLTAESTDWRPYRCNVCKTAYSQSSNLENHLRSVSHQSRVLRINELVVDGQININQPLIEQPDMLSEAQSQQLQQMMVEAMQQQQQLSAVSSQSLIFQALPGLNSMPMFPGMLPSATTALFNPTTAALASFANAAALESELADQIRHHDKSAGSKNASADRGAEKVQNSALNLTSDSAEGQRSVKLEPDSFVKALTASIKKEIEENGARRAADSLENPPVSQKSEMATNTMEGLSLTRGSDQPSNPTLAASIPVTVGRPRGYMGRFKPQIHRNLLENIGFECVMQFNECTQSRRRDREKDKEKETDKEIEEENAAKEENPEPVVKEEKEEETETRMDMPEINKSRCLMCGIEFSSLFVLKAHEEEVHNSMVPIDVVEDFGEKFKEDLEKKIPKHEPEPVPVSTPQPVQTSQPATSTISTDKASTSKATNSEMPPPPPPPPQLPPPYDMSQMMPMLGMMHPMQVPMNLVSLGMQPSLMPMMHGASMDMAANFPLQLGMMDPSLVSAQQQIQQAATNAQNQKRVRTRISDEQLKILRAHFDINNSPSEAQINQMSEQSGLPQKVIKHWFRNTLFKERQRNKDSPYNFSNPPSTTIDLEEYEKTGKIPQVKIEPSDDDDEPMPPQRQEEGETDLKQEPPTTPVPSADPMPKLEPGEDRRENESRSNASTPSNMSSIPSTPTCSAPPTPTPTATPGSIVDTHVAALARENAAAAAAAAQSSMTKRANRTRFTDFQIKQLQDYFEQNAYPKDDELDHLSRLLNLSPRVIVVWFQNARQKARKIYENQPAAEAQKEGSSPFQRTPSLNYQCKKCGAVFQRYYELIKHQKRPCLSENNNNKPLPSFTDDDSISSGTSLDDSCLSDSFNSSNLSMPSHKDTTPPSMSAAFRCDKCSSSFNRIDLWQEHQKVHNVTTTLFPPYSSSSAFGMLQSLAQQEDNKATSSVTSSSPGSTPVKRKLEAEEDKLDDQPRDKRLRTTILPEQLDYLYQKYQVDCNPSRKQLESIAQEVGLKKRVVQVWFQNTRARERKGQYRAHQQLIHKRCPFCRALFRAKSALESHLATKHPEEMAKGEINVDAIPDATMESPQPAHSMPSTSSAAHTGSADISKILSPTSVQPYLSFMPPASLSLGFPPPVPTDPQLQLSMKQIYEDSYKKYISELSASTHPPKPSHVMETPSPARHVKPEKRAPPPATSTGNDEDAPLDLSIPIKPSPNKNNGSSSSTPAATTVSSSNNSSHMAQTTSSRSSFIEMANREFERHRQNSHNESFSETHSDLADSEYQSEIGSSPPSPRSSSGGMPHLQNKRYRTQMTSLQVKVMKTLFVDYKTPTMSECELLGREIGLPKRVVQVWFQNARAKEKKSKLTMAKTFGGDMDFPKTPEECNLCNFKYSHKFTVQDHIFTKRHIDNVKSYIQSQSDAEREISDPASVSGLLRQQQSREMEQARKMWDKSSPSTSQHLAQLQGLNAAAAFGLPGSMAGVNSPFGLGAMPLMSELAASSGGKKSQQKDSTPQKEKKSETSKSSKEQQHQQEQQQQQQQQSQQQAAELAQMMALGGYLPGLDPAYLSFMYSGLPGYFPGMGAMPLLQPALLPGAEHLMAYDPLSFGTPLPLLQIPSQAIKSVSDKLQDANCTLAQYTQDCKTLADLKGMVNALDATCITESPVDVGYICKKCQMVYPVREACLTHQRMVCYVGGGEGGKTMLKLEQVQFECRICAEKFSTLHEFKVHCQAEAHKTKVHKLGMNFLPLSSSSSSSSSTSAKSALPAASLSVSRASLSYMSGSSPHSSSRVSVPVDSSPAHTVSSKKSPVAATASSHDSSEKDRLGHREAKE